MMMSRNNHSKQEQKILIVEDELLAAKLLQQIITQSDYHCVGIAKNADEAIELARTHKPKIILMDILLQGNVDGIEAAHKIREFSNSPIVYLTSYSDQGTKKRALQVRNSVYITKPYSQSYLLQTLKEIFDKLVDNE